MKGRAMSEQPMAYEEVFGSRTLQQAVEQPQRERWAYEELRPGDVIQEGDQWLNPDGRWQALVLTPEASMEVGDGVRARRPYKISAILEIGDALANAQKAAAQLQDDCEHARKERDAARASEARLSTELWARKPLEDRVSSLTDEVAQLRVERQEWINRCNANITSALQASEQLFAAKDAIKSAQRARDELQLQVDELRLELTSIASAEDVHSMLQEMLDDTEWVGQCLDSSTCEQMSCIQRTISVIAQRVGDME
jgi:hypothetical protein